MILKVSLCTLVLVYLIYVSYLDYTGQHMPEELTTLFNYALFRLALLVAVAVVAFTGHLECGILLAIAYLVSVSMANRESTHEAFTEYLTMKGGEDVTQEQLRDQESGITANGGVQQVGEGCVSYAPQNAFNPQPFRPNESIMPSGVPDQLPPSGDNFLSDPSGPYADSGVAYNMDMA